MNKKSCISTYILLFMTSLFFSMYMSHAYANENKFEERAIKIVKQIDKIQTHDVKWLHNLRKQFSKKASEDNNPIRKNFLEEDPFDNFINNIVLKNFVVTGKGSMLSEKEFYCSAEGFEEYLNDSVRVLQEEIKSLESNADSYRKIKTYHEYLRFFSANPMFYECLPKVLKHHALHPNSLEHFPKEEMELWFKGKMFSQLSHGKRYEKNFNFSKLFKSEINDEALHLFNELFKSEYNSFCNFLFMRGIIKQIERTPYFKAEQSFLYLNGCPSPMPERGKKVTDRN